jgi:thymidylate kinase
LRKGFLALAEAEPDRFRKIAVQQEMEETHLLVVEIVEGFLEDR